MQPRTTNMVRNVTMGMITGIAVGMLGHQMLSQNKRSLRRKANKVVDRMENAIENTRDMMFKG